MTGPLILNRQHSSTADHSKENKMNRPKPRRWSSADDQNPCEVTPDDHQYERKPSIKRNQTPVDNDSGVEDLDQQQANYACSLSNNVDEEDPLEDFGACVDEDLDEQPKPCVAEPVHDVELQLADQIRQLQLVAQIRDDLDLAALVPHDQKKDFCLNTMEVFHAEFARLISCPISLLCPGLRYFLFAEEEIENDPCEWAGFAFVKLDNAKAQFKCSNPLCRRLWTSMRARISFKISQPQANGFVVLKIYGQNCQHCQTPADALWYIEEVCRVMQNLSKAIWETFFPHIMKNDYLHDTNVIQHADQSVRRPRHDPHQRRGNMQAPHNRALCEACQHGWCYA